VQLVFTEVALGAIVLTINVVLLGGNIVFFQSLCLIGYCLFPIVLAAIICTLVKIAVRACLGWCCCCCRTRAQPVHCLSLTPAPHPPPAAKHTTQHVLQWARTLVLVVCLGWASWATVPFIGKTVSQQ
jgi:hypothetical protein